MTKEWHSEVEGWERQTTKTECLPVCLYNILTNLSKNKHYYEFLPVSLQKMKEIAGYAPSTGSSWDVALKGIRSRLQRKNVRDWEIRDLEGKGVKQDKMCKILSDDNCSFPVINLGPEYISEAYKTPLEGSPFTWIDHCVIALECEDSAITIYDPYTPFGRDHFNPIRKLDRNTFERYWVSSIPAKGMMWFQRVNQSLMQYGGGI